MPAIEFHLLLGLRVFLTKNSCIKHWGNFTFAPLLAV
jgi:hypothetical protein